MLCKLLIVCAGSQAPAWEPSRGSSSFPSTITKKGVIMPRSRYRVQCNPCPHFLTATVNRWLPLFTRPETVNIVLDSWRFLQQNSGFQRKRTPQPHSQNCFSLNQSPI